MGVWGGAFSLQKGDGRVWRSWRSLKTLGGFWGGGGGGRGSSRVLGGEFSVAVAVAFADVGGAGFTEDVPDFAARLGCGAADHDVAEDSFDLRGRLGVDDQGKLVEIDGLLCADGVTVCVEEALDDAGL